METETPGAVDPAGTGEGQYLRRAQALLAARSELFRPSRLAGIAGPPQVRQEIHLRHASRQLTLPLPRERSRRRARMVG